MKKKKLTFLGVSYRSNVADTRYSPVERFYNFCLKDGAEISLHDPYVSFWEELNLEVSQELFSIINNDMNILIISTSHDEYKSSNTFIKTLLEKDTMMIYDTVGLFSENELTTLSSKHDVKVLGRGDL